jgi:hypothetical protein
VRDCAGCRLLDDPQPARYGDTLLAALRRHACRAGCRFLTVRTPRATTTRRFDATTTPAAQGAAPDSPQPARYGDTLPAQAECSCAVEAQQWAQLPCLPLPFA